jgi:hypothetical protein
MGCSAMPPLILDVHPVQIALDKTWKNFQLLQIYRRISKIAQYQTLSNTGFRLKLCRMKSYKVTCHLKKKVGEKYGG